MLWPVIGLLSGAALGAVLSPMLWALDWQVQSDPFPPRWMEDAYGFVSWVGGISGAIGGLASGVACAGITWVLELRGDAPKRVYRWTATVVTAVLAVATVCVVLNFDLRAAGDLWALFVYMILPVVTSAGIAHLLGGWVWRRTHVDERDREPAPAF